MNEQFSQSPAPEMKGVKESVREAKEKLKSGGKEVASEFRERSEQFFDHNKSRTAERLRRVSASARDTANRFEQEQDPDLAHYTRLVADKLEGAASYIRERDFRDLKEDVE